MNLSLSSKNIAAYVAIIFAQIAYPHVSFAKNVCVFCSSKDSIAQIYKPEAVKLGKELALNNYCLVTGGRKTGLMKEVIDGHASINNNAPRYAIIPKVLQQYNVLHPMIAQNNITWTEDLHDRLKIFYSKCDAVIVLPGAFGTMHELMDAIENNKFGTIKLPVYILNIDHFWDPTLAQFKKMVAVNAMQASDLQQYKVVTSVAALLPNLNSVLK